MRKPTSAESPSSTASDEIGSCLGVGASWACTDFATPCVPTQMGLLVTDH
jgi:hypothetical protein